jgi:hypothetical protein
MDLFSETKNTGSSAFGSSKSSSSSSGNGASSGNGSSSWFSNFFSLNIQKMVLLLAVIAFIISVSTVAILLWKSKSAQKWPPEVATCPDRWVLNGTTCIDPYGLKTGGITKTDDNCAKYTAITAAANSQYSNSNLVGYIPWEGILDGDKTRSSNLKC